MAKVFGLESEPVVVSLTHSKKREYRVTNRLQECKRPLYAVVFNFINSRYLNVFATVDCGNRVTIYQCLEGGVIAVLQSYVDEDKDESFYIVSWACNVDGTPFVVARGINGIIRVIDTGTEKIHKRFSLPLEKDNISQGGFAASLSFLFLQKFPFFLCIFSLISFLFALFICSFQI